VKHLYGDYFAYLMQRHGLGNVYITNLVKCRESDGKKIPKLESSALIGIC
jgi:hypothetical protein